MSEKYDLSDINYLYKQVKQLVHIASDLNKRFDRSFTLDGHLMGSIGEVIAAYEYDIELLPASYKTHDAITLDEKYIQIKITQGKKINISSEPDYLLVLKLTDNEEIKEIYNGRGKTAWHGAGKENKNGRSISIAKLENLNKDEMEYRINKRVRI
ncbi:MULTISPECIES: DUF6998 domain-containing protein [unclassified Lacrimispora]|uniref:DUF6998 domain-containing protein n=1 Tax=unclassified Lacrimispora TaxID=2719232 RepID=UPI00376FCF38